MVVVVVLEFRVLWLVIVMLLLLFFMLVGVGVMVLVVGLFCLVDDVEFGCCLFCLGCGFWLVWCIGLVVVVVLILGVS